jgi:hypothetical protein
VSDWLRRRCAARHRAIRVEPGKINRGYEGSKPTHEQQKYHFTPRMTALRMIRETMETLGPPGILISEEEVLAKYGPEPIHDSDR